MHRLKILQYCKVKGEREVKPIYLSMKVKVKQLVAQSCPILCDPMDCSLPGSSVHGILQARLLEWIAMPFSRGSSRPGRSGSPTLQADSLPSELPGKPIFTYAMPTISDASGREPSAIAGDKRHMGLIPGSGRSPGGGHGNPLQYSCLENPMDKGAWQATVHRAAKSWAGLK